MIVLNIIDKDKLVTERDLTNEEKSSVTYTTINISEMKVYYYQQEDELPILDIEE